MDSTKVLDQLDSLIDDLLNDSDLPASSLASMLMAARDSVKDGYHFALARRVCDASNAIRDRYSSDLCVMGSSFGDSRVRVSWRVPSCLARLGCASGWQGATELMV